MLGAPAGREQDEPQGGRGAPTSTKDEIRVAQDDGRSSEPTIAETGEGSNKASPAEIGVSGSLDSKQEPIPPRSKVRLPTDVERDNSSTITTRNNAGDSRNTTRSPPFDNHSAEAGIPLTLPPSPANPSSPLSATSSSSLPHQPKSRTRDRGYSLRRALFARNMHSQSEQNGVVMEMETASSSSSNSTHIRFQDKKENKTHPEVTVSALSSDLDPELPQRPVRLVDTHHRQWSFRSFARLEVYGGLEKFYHQTRKRMGRINEIPQSVDGRHVDLDLSAPAEPVDERTQKPYVNNVIRSCRYTVLNFFPRQLFAQFSKLANFYFLCVSILQMLPGLSTTGTYTTIVPLVIFVGLSMAKEGYDDIRRYRLDKEENNREAQVLELQPFGGLSSAENQAVSSSYTHERYWKPKKWSEVKVADVVRVRRDEPVPADLVILSAEDINGTAYIETMALDGETNLKSKQPISALRSLCKTPESIASTKAHFVVEDPNIDLYKFEGRVGVGEDTFPLTNSEIIYRGSVVRNCQSATGLVIYSGEECKIRMNATKRPRIKAPSLQIAVNKVVIFIAVFVLVLSLICTLAYQVWSRVTERKSWYLQRSSIPFGYILTSFIIMFNTMLPLSLYVSLEIIKLGQMALMNDIDMYDEESETPMVARTSTINEDLGQVSHIFSDKTGTLTNNSMRFRKLSVAGTAWLHDQDLQDEALQNNKARLIHKKRHNKGKTVMSRKRNICQTDIELQKSYVTSLDGAETPTSPKTPRFSVGTAQWQPSTRTPRALHCGRTNEMLEYIRKQPQSLFARKAKFFILGIALCHTCVPETDADGTINIQATSPDELALVQAAQTLGYIMIDRQSSIITMKTFPMGANEEPTHEKFEILDVIEFSSARKRMSVIVRLPNDQIYVFCKGADSAISTLLRLSDLADEQAMDIKLRAKQKKNLEVQGVLRRQSEQRNNLPVSPRVSFNIGRRSLGSISLAGVAAPKGREESVHDSIDHWLKERESDIDLPDTKYGNQFHSPRPSTQPGSPRISTQMGGRVSLTHQSGGRMSSQVDLYGDFMDESVILNDQVVLERCFQHIHDFATEGLRTLMYGYRLVSEEEYTTWKALYLEATTSLTDRQVMTEKAGGLIEKQLELLGVTAIEDKLQIGVPDTIDRLWRAGIKLWMLTGDKRETAINIGHSCRLVKDYSTLIVVDHATGAIDHRMEEAIADINRGVTAHSVVVVDGYTLSLIDVEPVLRELFTKLMILADSVICCRASPSQKASLVKTIRTEVKGSVTLAIGDGANDIAMIQEAHVGIGITGKEGLQAARTSDWSIPQFRFLLKLLLVHGRWNYVRVCKYTLGTFWKETLFYLTQALYQRWNGYTGTSLYESWSLTFFNTLFTSLPVVFLGLFEKDLAASTLLAVPELYSFGQRNCGFSMKIYFWWAVTAFCEATCIFFIMYGLYGEAIFTSDNGIFAMGSITFTACIVLISLKLQVLELHNKSITAVIAVLLSVGGWFAWNLVLSAIYSNNVIYLVKDGLLHSFGQSLLWWLTLILVVTAVVILELGIGSIRTAVCPTDVDIFQQLEQDRDVKKRFEESAADYLQQGWDRGTKKSSLELAREAEAEAIRQAEREAQVQELLDRPRMMEEGRSDVPAAAAAATASASGQQVRRRHSSQSHDGDDDLLATREGNGKIGG